MAVTPSSGLIDINNIHVNVGDGPSGSLTSLGASDMGPRMGYTGFKSFAYFHKSWGTLITHGSRTDPAYTIGKGAETPTAYLQGYTVKSNIFSPGSAPIGSVAKNQINPGTAPAGAIFTDFLSTQGGNYPPSGEFQFGIQSDLAYTAILATEPYRCDNTARVTWNNILRPVGLNSSGLASPTVSNAYFTTKITLPTSGNYNFGIRWV